MAKDFCLVLGIDSGIAACGYALVRFGPGTRETLKSGIVETRPNPDREKRDDVLARGVQIAQAIQAEVVNAITWQHKLDILVIEDVVGAPNRNTQHACSCTVGTLSGWLQASLHPRYTALLDPGEIKRIFGAPAFMTKMQKSWVMEMFTPYHPAAVSMLEPVTPHKRNHAWDAIATAEAVCLLRPEWAQVDPWAGIRGPAVEPAPVVKPKRRRAA